MVSRVFWAGKKAARKIDLAAKHSICAERGALTPSQASPHISSATMVSIRLVVKPGSQRNPGNNICAAGVGQESVAERTTRCQSHGGAHKRKMSGPGKSSTRSRADAAGNTSSKCKSAHSISSKFVLGRTKKRVARKSRKHGIKAEAATATATTNISPSLANVFLADSDETNTSNLLGTEEHGSCLMSEDKAKQSSFNNGDMSTQPGAPVATLASFVTPSPYVNPCDADIFVQLRRSNSSPESSDEASHQKESGEKGPRNPPTQLAKKVPADQEVEIAANRVMAAQKVGWLLPPDDMAAAAANPQAEDYDPSTEIGSAPRPLVQTKPASVDPTKLPPNFFLPNDQEECEDRYANLYSANSTSAAKRKAASKSARAAVNVSMSMLDELARAESRSSGEAAQLQQQVGSVASTGSRPGEKDLPSTNAPVQERSNAYESTVANQKDPAYLFVKLEKPIGLTLAQRGGMRETRVEAIRPDSAADRTGQITIGNMLLSVNGEDVRNISFKAVLEVINKGGPVLDLTFLNVSLPKPVGASQKNEMEQNEVSLRLAANDKEEVTRSTAANNLGALLNEKQMLKLERAKRIALERVKEEYRRRTAEGGAASEASKQQAKKRQAPNAAPVVAATASSLTSTVAAEKVATNMSSLSPQIRSAISANQSLKNIPLDNGDEDCFGKPIQKDDPWMVVEVKLLDAGWTKQRGRGLVDFYFICPCGKTNSQGGVENVDYFSSKLAIKLFAIKYLDWGGDAETKAYNGPDDNSRRSRRCVSSAVSAAASRVGVPADDVKKQAGDTNSTHYSSAKLNATRAKESTATISTSASNNTIANSKVTAVVKDCVMQGPCGSWFVYVLNNGHSYDLGQSFTKREVASIALGSFQFNMNTESKATGGLLTANMVDRARAMTRHTMTLAESNGGNIDWAEMHRLMYWNEMYRRLSIRKSKDGVASIGDEDDPLYQWTQCQKRLCLSSDPSLTSEKKRLLDAIGFDWDDNKAVGRNASDSTTNSAVATAESESGNTSAIEIWRCQLCDEENRTAVKNCGTCGTFRSGYKQTKHTRHVPAKSRWSPRRPTPSMKANQGSAKSKVQNGQMQQDLPTSNKKERSRGRPPSKLCTVDGCREKKAANCHEMCLAHYRESTRNAGEAPNDADTNDTGLRKRRRIDNSGRSVTSRRRTRASSRPQVQQDEEQTDSGEEKEDIGDVRRQRNIAQIQLNMYRIQATGYLAEMEAQEQIYKNKRRTERRLLERAKKEVAETHAELDEKDRLLEAIRRLLPNEEDVKGSKRGDIRCIKELLDEADVIAHS